MDKNIYEILSENKNLQLTNKEEKILKLRYGIYDGDPNTLEEIGKIYNITRERVHQIEERALRKLNI